MRRTAQHSRSFWAGVAPRPLATPTARRAVAIAAQAPQVWPGGGGRHQPDLPGLDMRVYASFARARNRPSEEGIGLGGVVLAR